MWAILNTLTSSDTEDVTIDNGANWKAVRPINNTGIKVRIYYLFVIFFFFNLTNKIYSHYLYRLKMTVQRVCTK